MENNEMKKRLNCKNRLKIDTMVFVSIIIDKKANLNNNKSLNVINRSRRK